MKNRLCLVLLVIVLGVIFVSCSEGEVKVEDLNITLKSVSYETEDGVQLNEIAIASLNIDHYEFNGTVFSVFPYSIDKISADKPYDYTVKAFDAEGNLVASATGQVKVTEGGSIELTVTLILNHQHTYDSTWSNDETNHWHAANCGHDLTKDSAAHTFGEVSETKTATCTAAGAGTQTCTVCGYVNAAVIPALGHNVVDNVCTRCGKFVPFIGPAGGYVFYDCDADNTPEDPDGADDLKSSECGWRYLEAAPSDLTDGESDRFPFGYYIESYNGYVQSVYVNGTTEYNEANCTRRDIGTGKTNTQMHVSAMGAAGEKAYTNTARTATTDKYAAKLALDYSITVGETTYDDWFLPSQDELYLMYTNLKYARLGDFSNSYYWSSSESGGLYECIVDFQDGRKNVAQRESHVRVRCIRSYL